MTRAIHRLKHMIFGFELLPQSEQDAFLQSIQPPSRLYTVVHQQELSSHQMLSSFTLRYANLYYQAQAPDIQQLLQQHPEYPSLIRKINLIRLKKLGIPTEILSQKEADALISKHYYQVNRFDDFFTTTDEHIVAIQKKINSYFNNEFGFLFHTHTLKFFIEIHLLLDQMQQDAKNRTLIALLYKDWNLQSFNIAHFLKPAQEFLSNNIATITEPVSQYVDEMQSAHLFYRFFGISSDHMVLGNNAEYSFFPFVNIFDYSIYHSSRQSIHDAMKVWKALFRPLKPFFHEYVEMAQTEKNLINMMFRAFMPFLIMSIVLSLGYAAVLPLAYHQLIEYIFFIPAFYFSIIIASQYIQIKNYLYLQFVQLYYGSIYKTQYFQADDTLIRTFQSNELANQIAQYYAWGLEECDKIEKAYQYYPLNSQHIDARQANIQLKSDLSKEWRDFKTSLLPIEKIARTFESRLHKDNKFCHARVKELIDIYFKSNEARKESIKLEFQTLKLRLNFIQELKGKIKNLDYRAARIEEQNVALTI